MKTPNGSYPVEHRTLGTKYTLKAYNGSLRLFDVNTDIFIRRINEPYLKEWYYLGERMKSETTLWDIVWFVDGRVKEKIPMRASYGICMHRLNELKRSSHKSGLLKVVKHHTP
ncbi:MAG: hypothetical protein IT212_07770 [Bacteroidia bacterium]|nr:hypothetical protein [Bacteroidia bacterium]